MPVSEIVYILLAIGIITQFIKLVDFLLPRKYQKALQLKVELWALQLDAINPLNLYPLLITHRNIRVLFITMVIGMVTFFLGYAALDTFKTLKTVADLLEGIAGLVLASTYEIFMVRRSFKKRGAYIIQFIYSDGKFGLFMNRFMKVFAYLIFFLMLFIGVFMAVEALNREIYMNIFLGAYSIILLVKIDDIILWLTVLYAGFFIIAFWVFAQLARTAIFVVTKVVWKIANYIKGVLAALTLLFTFVLALIEMYLKYHK